MLLLGLITIWDTFTTVYGTHLIFGDGFVQMAASIGFSLILTGFLLRTIPIIKNPSDDLIPAGAKILWFIAIGYDVFTSFTGNMDLILGNASGTQKVILAIGLTIFVCSAPIGLSKLYFQPED
jgi:hypothetical protein